MFPSSQSEIVVFLAFIVVPVEIACSKDGTNVTAATLPSIAWSIYYDDSKSCSLNLDFCSPWVYCDNGECQCGEAPNQILQCNIETNVSVLDGNCLTYNKEKHVTEVGRCIFTNIKTNSSYTLLPRSLSELDDFMCGKLFNRTGTLCGKCKDGHYPLVYSFDMNCIQCPNGKANWWKYLLAAYLPLTVFYLVVLLFKINVVSSSLYPFVFYAQMVSAPVNGRIALMYMKNQRTSQMATRWFGLFYGIWNLDFFRSFDLGICLGIDSMQALSLDLAVGVYPLSLLLVTYMLIHLYDRNFAPIVTIWKPFQVVLRYTKRKIEMRTTLIDAFCTFFLLSNTKLLSSCADLLMPVTVYELNSTGHLSYSWRLYNNPAIPYFGHQHLPYAILAMGILFPFVTFPVLLLTLYPFRWFQKLLNLFPVRWYILHTFVDSFQGCYKDGTEPGTGDYRWCASILFGLRCLLLLIAILTLNATYFPIATIVLVIVAMLFVALQPFKEKKRKMTQFQIVFILLLAMGYTFTNGTSSELSAGVFIILSITAVLPLLYLSVIILHWGYTNCTFGVDVIRRLQAKRHGYEILQV